jgi:hypothetical protein
MEELDRLFKEKKCLIYKSNPSKNLTEKILNYKIKETKLIRGREEPFYRQKIPKEITLFKQIKYYFYDFFLKENNKIADIIKNIENISIQRITVGEKLDLHTDNESQENLKYLALAYFTKNNNYYGREFFWKENEENLIEHKPKNGDILLFKADTPHGVKILLSNDNITTVALRICY